MKTIVTLLLALYIHTVSFAQRPQWTTVSLENKSYTTEHYIYFKDINHSLDKFIGTWIYNQGNDSFKITFIKKLNQPSPINHFQKLDLLISHYEYKQNGTIIFETYTTNFSLVDYVLLKDSDNMVMLYGEPSFTHPSKKRIGDLLVTYSLNSSNQPILTWVRTDYPVRELPIPYRGYTTSDISDFIAPANMILIKE
ncbi:DUF6705 family protein [Flavobacterium sp. '19STA2R22 D10 B1']|uniref:DUF6705 family protein n=1 Tax=Flavobacterium aerium TaxID=3037261 RepID=UPI00278BBD30|nr:DUF6705 family protein [Flavobacterium sp. '19STA2R22 D10 B1']